MIAYVIIKYSCRYLIIIWQNLEQQDGTNDDAVSYKMLRPISKLLDIRGWLHKWKNTCEWCVHRYTYIFIHMYGYKMHATKGSEFTITTNDRAMSVSVLLLLRRTNYKNTFLSKQPRMCVCVHCVTSIGALAMQQWNVSESLNYSRSPADWHWNGSECVLWVALEIILRTRISYVQR